MERNFSSSREYEREKINNIHINFEQIILSIELFWFEEVTVQIDYQRYLMP
jgi:hypothetical protein